MRCRNKRTNKKQKGETEEDKYNKTKLSKLGRSVFEQIFQNSLNVCARIKVLFRNHLASQLESAFLDVRKTLISAEATTATDFI